MSLAGDDLLGLVERGGCRQGYDVCARRHDFAHVGVPELHNGFDHVGIFFVNGSDEFAFRDGAEDLLADLVGLGLLFVRFRNAGEASDQAIKEVMKSDQGVEDPL